jgi:hypothetical protein
MIPYENRRKLPKIAQDIGETCLEHDRKFEVYCSDHQESCCINLYTASGPIWPIDVTFNCQRPIWPIDVFFNCQGADWADINSDLYILH